MDAAEKEIQALIALLDDSDNEVFDHVAQRLFSYGPQVISKLEDAYTSIPDQLAQERIEGIIKHIQFTTVEKDFKDWIRSDSDDLLKGTLIINRHRYPELDEAEITAKIQKIKKDIWLGLNNYLSPLEQVNVVNQVLFNQMGFSGNIDPAADLPLSYFHNVLDKNKGNHFSLGLLYLILCQQLEMPVYGVCLASHFILTRCKEYIIDFTDMESLRSDVLFYINPYNKGLAFGEKEITVYLNKVDMLADEKYFLPASNKTVLREYLSWLQNLYVKSNEKNNAFELDNLKALLDE
ncbi:MAG: transglutaminase-like domain-containing protein [Chitinophagales bacterium]|nr:transglutaminase family protein [Bacteroidota bacterium]MBK8487321.1 transglutaminase family protein [Bacteroidota bacterium]MBK8682940.1 transglutaminase family protein [Bacteroidota bacterium]